MRYVIILILLCSSTVLAAEKRKPGPYDLCVRQGGTMEACKHHLPASPATKALEDLSKTTQKSAGSGNQPAKR